MKPTIDSKLNIGAIIRDSIIPSNTSVTEAAKLLEVSRPTLSKLLNGHTSLSHNMAKRLHKVFGADMKELLSIQTDLLSGNGIHTDQLGEMARNVPMWPIIKALDIEKWGSSTIEAQNLLPVLLRRLIQETSRYLQKVDFPGYDNAQRHGFDGQVIANSVSLNVPEGQSIWELSVQSNPRGKAENDYQARLDCLPVAERAETSFVFVTTHIWKVKNKWVSQKNDTGEWKDVHVLDASDLEQWLERTFSVRVWLAEKMGIPVRGIRSLGTCWKEWSMATDPPMTSKLFLPHIQGYKNTFLNWLTNLPQGPFKISSDSYLESLAFIACLLKEIEIPQNISSNALVFDSVDSLDLLHQMSDRVIAIIADDKIQHIIADTYKNHYCILVRPKNISGEQHDIVIDSLGSYSLEKALREMGIERYRIDLIIRESGLSPTVLRRRLSGDSVIQKPKWADGFDKARKLIPLSLAGVWNSGLNSDREILSMLAENSYRDIEISIAELSQLDESPIWSIDKNRGIRSRVDVLFSVAHAITESDLIRFLEISKKVLSVPQKTLIDAAVKNQESAPHSPDSYNHSDTLRSGIRDTLSLLSIHGNGIFLRRLGINVEQEIANLIKHLLTPFSEEVVWFHYRDFPDFAEATPKVFLNILQQDLNQSKSELKLLVQSTTGDIIPFSPRVDILWALERLAWHPDYFTEVVNILAELSVIPIHDNLAATPMRSLSAIFHSWLPQTSVSVKDRINALESLCKRFPKIGWKICIRQMDHRNDYAEESNRPRWRSVESIEPVDQRETMEFKWKIQEIILHWPNHDEHTLSDLLLCLFRVNKNIQMKILGCVQQWEITTNDSKCRSIIREAIGNQLYSIGHSYTWIDSDVRKMAYDLFKDLLPNDSYESYALLFGPTKDYFPIASMEDPSIERRNWYKQAPLFQEKVIQRIWASDGIKGVLKLLSKCSSGYKLGQRTAFQKMTSQQGADTIRECLLADIVPPQKINEFLNGFISSLDDSVFTEAIPILLKKCTDKEIERILHYVPFKTQISQRLDQVSDHISNQWWKDVSIPLRKYSTTDAGLLIENLMRVERQWDALLALSVDYDIVKADDLKRLLEGIADQCSSVPKYSDEISHYLSKARDSLGKRSGISIAEMAELEFAFLTVFVPPKCKVPFIEKQFSESPSHFIDCLLILENRKTISKAVNRLNVEDEKLQQAQKLRATILFQALERLPGQSDHGDIDVDVLIRWITDVRGIATEYECIKSCDEMLGQWLSKAPQNGMDNQWPTREVCEILENFTTESMRVGFKIGTLNIRDRIVQLPYKGGDQDQDLADLFRRRAEQCRPEFPYVSKILNDISERYEKDVSWMDQREKSRMYLDL